jgi:hypothetical protein
MGSELEFWKVLLGVTLGCCGRWYFWPWLRGRRVEWEKHRR